MMLSRNRIKRLPNSISKMTSLTMLWLDVNQLDLVTPALSFATQLRSLKLNFNNLTTLPPEMCRLACLPSEGPGLEGADVRCVNGPDCDDPNRKHPEKSASRCLVGRGVGVSQALDGRGVRRQGCAAHSLKFACVHSCVSAGDESAGSGWIGFESAAMGGNVADCVAEEMQEPMFSRHFSHFLRCFYSTTSYRCWTSAATASKTFSANFTTVPPFH
jgi:Leucine-rich repeat (LRR) protein